MRKYLDWARPYCERVPERDRSDLVALDRWLYSKRSAGALMGFGASTMGFGIALRGAGAKRLVAVMLTVLIYVCVTFAAIGLWMGHETVAAMRGKPRPKWRRNPWVGFLGLLLMGYLGAQDGLLVARATLHTGEIRVELMEGWVLGGLKETMPFTLALMCALMAVVGVTLVIKQQQLRRRLQHIQHAQEREAQAAPLAKAQLKLLQTQVKQNFVFNTFAAVQHWIDTQDPRASALLQSLTSFCGAAPTAWTKT